MAVKHFGGLGISLHAPVVDGRVRHQGDGVYRDPLPEHDVLRHGVSLHLALHLNVKDLQRLCSCGAAGVQGGGGRGGVQENMREDLAVLEEGHGQDEDDDSWMIKSLLLFDTLDELLKLLAVVETTKALYASAVLCTSTFYTPMCLKLVLSTY